MATRGSRRYPSVRQALLSVCPACTPKVDLILHWLETGLRGGSEDLRPLTVAPRRLRRLYVVKGGRA